MYHQIRQQQASLTIDCQTKDRNIKRKEKKIEELEKQTLNLKEDSNHTKMQLDELKSIIKKRLPDAEQILTQPVFQYSGATYIMQSNVVKPLKGGGGIFRILKKYRTFKIYFSSNSS